MRSSGQPSGGSGYAERRPATATATAAAAATAIIIIIIILARFRDLA